MMDADRFDAITKILVTTGSRRRALGGVLATVTAVLIPGWLGAAERKQRRRHRKRTSANDHSPDVSASAKNGKKKKRKNPTPKPAPTPNPPPSDCSTGQTECRGQCVNTKTNPQHCGRCDVLCTAISANMECVESACMCKPDFAFCGDPDAPSGGSCVTLGTVEHCQGCGNTCTGDPCEIVTCDQQRGCQRMPIGDGESCGSNRFCHAGACIDYGFPDTLKLPWCAGEREPRRLTQDWDGHNAIGIALDFGRRDNGDAVKGTLVLAPMAGTVQRNPIAGSTLGNHVLIDAGNGWQAILAHLDAIDANLGSSVSIGDVIGTLGDSGIRGTPDCLDGCPHIHIDLFIGVGNRKYEPRIDKLDRLFGHPHDAFDCPEDSGCADDQAFYSTQRECAGDPCAGVDCSGLSNACTDGICASSGKCIAQPKPNGASCGDGGSCVNGTCGLSMICSTSPPCGGSLQCGLVGQYGCYCNRGVNGANACTNNFLIGRTNLPTGDGQCINTAACEAHFGTGFVCIRTCYGQRCAPPCGNASY